MDKRNELLAADDNIVLNECRVDVFRGTGRGGQKRNTTNSAVRVTHVSTGVSAVSDKTRSQVQNKKEAIRELRRELALIWREPPPSPPIRLNRPSSKNRLYPVWMATILDALHACEYRVSEAAAALNTNTGQFVKEIQSDPELWQYINRKRQELDLKPLRKTK